MLGSLFFSKSINNKKITSKTTAFIQHLFQFYVENSFAGFEGSHSPVALDRPAMSIHIPIDVNPLVEDIRRGI